MRVSVVVIRCSKDGLYPPVQDLAGDYVDVDNDRFCVSQICDNSQLFQMRICQNIWSRHLSQQFAKPLLPCVCCVAWRHVEVMLYIYIYIYITNCIIIL